MEKGNDMIPDEIIQAYLKKARELIDSNSQDKEKIQQFLRDSRTQREGVETWAKVEFASEAEKDLDRCEEQLNEKLLELVEIRESFGLEKDDKRVKLKNLEIRIEGVNKDGEGLIFWNILKFTAFKLYFENCNIFGNQQSSRCFRNGDPIVHPPKNEYFIGFKKEILSNMCFYKCSFKNLVKFEECKLYSSFQDCKFEKEVKFNRANFIGGANFNGTTFEKKVDFSNVVFQKETDFSQSTFLGIANFRDTTFKGRSEFCNATFESEANFNTFLKIQEGGFKDFANFYNTSFKGEVDFTNTIFEKDAIFETSSLEKAFDERVSFKESKFLGNVNFKNRIFKEEADFSNSLYKDQVYFNNASFKGGIDFHESEFEKTACFYGVVFDQAPNFSQAIFKGNLNLINAELKFDFENLKSKIEQNKEKEKTISRIANDFRDSFRLFKNTLSKEGNLLDASNFHKVELYCKEIELDSKKPSLFSRDWIDKWLLLCLYRKTSDHHTDLLKIWYTLISLIGIFGILSIGVIVWLNLYFGNDLTWDDPLNAKAFYDCHISTLIDKHPWIILFINLGFIIVFFILFCLSLCKYPRVIFLILGYAMTFFLLATSPKFLVPAIGFFTDKREWLDSLSIIGGIYTILFGFIFYSFIKTARKNSIVPS